MNDFERIQSKVSAGGTLALWGIARHAETFLNKLKKQYNTVPDMVIDSNKSRHGKRFVGVPVVSFETALKSAPDDLEIFILEGKFTNEVLGYLHEKHFPPERIINYEPVVKAACCPLADANLVMSGNALFSCCSEDGKLIPPRVEYNGDIREALTEFISMRKGLLNSISEGRFSSCTGCHEIKNSFHPLHPRIRTLSYGDGGVCNFKCSYCITGASGAKGSYDRDIDLSEALRALKEMGAPLENMMLEFGSGEPTLHRERERYYKAMSEVGTVLVLTNGSVFDAALAERMSKGGFSICVSIDAGTRETYKKIKGKPAGRFLRMTLMSGIMIVISLCGVFVNETPENRQEILHNLERSLNE